MHPCIRVALGVALIASSARADSIVPTPDVVVDESVKAAGQPGATLTGTFYISNQSQCSVLLSQARTLVRGISVSCPSWTLAARAGMGCEITATSDSEGKLRDRLLLQARIGEDCKVDPLAIVADRERNELGPLLDEQTKVRREDPDPVGLTEREKKLTAAAEAALKSLEGREDELDDEARQMRAMLTQLFRESVAENIARIEELVMKLNMLPQDDSAMQAFQARLEKIRAAGMSDIAKAKEQTATTCSKIRELEDKKDRIVRELRAGAWHNLCKLTESEIWEQRHERLADHLKNEGGEMIPVPEEVIRSRAAEYDERIKAAKMQCVAASDHEADVKEKAIGAVRDFEAKRADIERAKQEALDNTRKELDAQREWSRKKTIKQNEKMAEVDRKLAKDKEALEEKREQLRRDIANGKKTAAHEHEKAVQEYAEKRRKIDDKVDKLRMELVVLGNTIRNAHQTVQNLGVVLEFTFQK